MRREVSFDQGRHWTPVKLSPNEEGHARFYRVTNSEVANLLRFRSRKDDSEFFVDL